MFDHCIYFNTTALARQLEKAWTRAFKEFGLTPPQAFMLRAILDQPGLAQCEIARQLFIARPTATRALDGLVAKGMVVRRGSKADGREQVIYPTAVAVAMRGALTEASRRAGDRLKGQLGEDAFKDTVNKIRNARIIFKRYSGAYR